MDNRAVITPLGVALKSGGPSHLPPFLLLRPKPQVFAVFAHGENKRDEIAAKSTETNRRNGNASSGDGISNRPPETKTKKEKKKKAEL